MNNWEMIVIALSMAIIALAVVAFFVALIVLVVYLTKFASKAKKEIKKESDELEDVTSSLKRFFKGGRSHTVETTVATVLKGALLGLTLWQDFKRRK